MFYEIKIIVEANNAVEAIEAAGISEDEPLMVETHLLPKGSQREQEAKEFFINEKNES